MAVSTERSQSRLLALATIIAVVSVLYFARDVLIPLAMAILLSFLLAPVVRHLQRLELRRIPAVLIAVTSASAMIFVVAWIFLYQMVDLGEQLPAYKENIAKRVETLNKSFSPWLRRATEAIEDVNTRIGDDKSSEPKTENNQAELSTKQTTSVALNKPNFVSSNVQIPDSRNNENVIPVRVVSGPTSFTEILNGFVGPVLAPLGTAALIAILVIFILIEREDLRNRFIRLVGNRQLHQTTDALDDASTRVSRYLLMLLIVNVTYGIAVGFGLWFIGMPNVAIWGLMATVLRFIPYVGPWIAAAMPIVLSLAIFEGWLQPLLVIGLFIVLELLSNNVMEPMLYGSSTGISAFGIIISAVFWTWLWGGVGLVLSTPLTVCLMVLGRHVPQFHYLEILLGDQPPLPISASIYQRLLASDEDEVAKTAKKYLTEHPLGELFDDVLLPALQLANQDHQQGRLDENRWVYVHDLIRELIVDLQEEAQVAATKDAAIEAKQNEQQAIVATTESPNETMAKPLVPENSTKTQTKGKVLCLAALDISDELAGQMLAVLLVAEGYEVEVQAPHEQTAKETKDSSTRESVIEQPQVLWISALPPLAEPRAREQCRALAKRHPRAAINVGLWNETLSDRNQAQLRRAGARDIAGSLREAVQQTNDFLLPKKVDPLPAPIPADEPSASEPLTAEKDGVLAKHKKTPSIAG